MNSNTVEILIKTTGAAVAAGMVDQLKSSLIRLGLEVYAATKAMEMMRQVWEMPLKGMELNKEMESSRLGIASIIAATQELTALDGRRLTGMEKFVESQKVASEVMRDIQVAGLETTATTQELVAGFQQLLGPASEAGLTMRQTRDFTVQMVQAMGALGVQMNQLSAEGRSLLDGTIVPTQDRLAVVLGITGDMVKKWREGGRLFEELSARLEPFKLAGASVAETWAGLASNMKEAIAFVAGKMTAGLFEDVKSSWKSIISLLLDVKNFDAGSGIQNLLTGAKAVMDMVGGGLRQGMEYIVSLIQSADEYLGQHKRELQEILTLTAGIGREMADVVGQAVSLVGTVLKVSFELGVINDMFYKASVLVTALNIGFKTLDAGIRAVSQLLVIAFVAPLQGVLDLMGKIGSYFDADWSLTLIGAARDLQGSVDRANKGLAETVQVVSNGLIPAEKKSEESLKTQNGLLEKYLGTMKALGEEGKKAKHQQEKDADMRKWVVQEEKYADAVDKAGQKILDDMDKRDKAIKQYRKTLEDTKEAEIRLALRDVDLGAQGGQTGANEVYNERVRLYQQLLAVQQQYIQNVDKEADPGEWITKMNAIDDTREAILRLQKDNEKAQQAAREAEIQYQLNNIDLAEQEYQVGKADAIEERIRLYRELLGIQEDYLATLDKLKDPSSWYAQQEAIRKTREEMIKLNLEEKRQTGSFGEGMGEGFKRYIHDAKTTFQLGEQMADEAARAMTASFSDFFFDAMTGKLKSLGSYIKSFLNSILKALADVYAQMMVKGLMSGFAGGGWTAQQSSKIGAGNLTAIHSGGYIAGINRIARYHDGAAVGRDGQDIFSRFNSLSGLEHDEVLAVMKIGEFVINDRAAKVIGIDTLHRLNGLSSSNGLSSVNNPIGSRFHAGGAVGTASGGTRRGREQPQGQGGGDTIVNITVENKTGLPLNFKQTGIVTDEKTRVKNIMLELMFTDPGFKDTFK